jgi:hypothetical protein
LWPSAVTSVSWAGEREPCARPRRPERLLRCRRPSSRDDDPTSEAAGAGSGGRRLVHTGARSAVSVAVDEARLASRQRRGVGQPVGWLSTTRRWSRRGSLPPARTRPGTVSHSGLAEAVENGLRGDGPPCTELLVGTCDRRVQTLAIGVIEGIAFLVVEAAKQAIDQLSPFFGREPQRFRSDLLCLSHPHTLRSRDWLDKSEESKTR